MLLRRPCCAQPLPIFPVVNWKEGRREKEVKSGGLGVRRGERGLKWGLKGELGGGFRGGLKGGLKGLKGGVKGGLKGLEEGLKGGGAERRMREGIYSKFYSPRILFYFLDFIIRSQRSETLNITFSSRRREKEI